MYQNLTTILFYLVNINIKQKYLFHILFVKFHQKRYSTLCRIKKNVFIIQKLYRYNKKKGALL